MTVRHRLCYRCWHGRCRSWVCLSGKWPHNTIDLDETALTAVNLRRFWSGEFFESTVFGNGLDNVLTIDSLAALDAWRDGCRSNSAAFRHY